MNTYAKLGIAAAAVVVVVIVGINLMPASGGLAGGRPRRHAVTFTDADARPRPDAGADRSANGRCVPARGPARRRHAHGRTRGHSASRSPSQDQVGRPARAASSARGRGGQPEDFALALWDSAPDDVYSDPCAHTRLSPPPSHTTAGLAAAAAAIPGTDLVSGPESVEVGGRPAQHVVFTVRDDLGCDPMDAYLWVYDGNGAANNWHWASGLGSTHQVWTIDVDGKVIWIDSESYKGAGPEIGQAIQQVIDSIQFE